MIRPINRITFTVCGLLNQISPDQRAISEVKEGEPRDVVTKLDQSIHVAVKELVSEHLPRAVFLSEEQENQNMSLLSDLPVVVLDPIDGSQNLSLGLPFSSCLIAIIEGGKVVSSAVISLDASRLMIYDQGWLWSNFYRIEVGSSKPTCLAYGPLSNQADRDAMLKVWDKCDRLSSGVYRWGSAAAGLQALVNGQLQSFVGLKLRIWDFLAFLPFLHLEGINVALKIGGQRGTIVACRELAEFDSHVDSLTSVGEHVIRFSAEMSLAEVI
jgi:myo-inositol-1(or 4)-monophosphatase